MRIGHPLISCICITRNKPFLLQRAISCFNEQTYENRELIIIYEDDDLLTKAFIDIGQFDSRIRFFVVRRESGRTLGSLRNLGIEMAQGEYVCQWDDDDWYHTGRIEYQYAVLKETGYKGCVLTRWIVYDSVLKNAYVSNTRLWEGSIFCWKEILSLKPYEDKRFGEDTSVVNFLYSNKWLYPVTGAPNLYIYVYHGNNTWPLDHWNFIFAKSEKLPPENAQVIERILSGEYTQIEASLILDELLGNPIFE